MKPRRRWAPPYAFCASRRKRPVAMWSGVVEPVFERFEERRGVVLRRQLPRFEFFDQRGERADEAAVAVGVGAVDGGDAALFGAAGAGVGAGPELPQALVPVAGETATGQAAVGQAHEDERDAGLRGERLQRQRVAVGVERRFFPGVGDPGHLRVCGLGARFAAFPVGLGFAVVSGGDEDRPHAASAGDRAQQARALEEDVVVLVGDDVHRPAVAGGFGSLRPPAQGEEEDERGYRRGGRDRMANRELHFLSSAC